MRAANDVQLLEGSALGTSTRVSDVPFSAVPQIAVLIPCYNEALTIANVVRDFQKALPGSRIYVYDNNSSDETVKIASEAGAICRCERRQGKGHVVRRMFSDIQADCYILVDGDGTYDASVAASVADLVLEQGYDFVNVARSSVAAEAYRRGHRTGNLVLTQIVRFFFGRNISDMLSGYKALSRRFVKSYPAMARGFETETELTVHALEMRMPMTEISAVYSERPDGSESKLRTFRDGTRILMLISRLVKDERPMQFFGWLGLFIMTVGTVLSLPVIFTFLETGLVPRLPTAILSVSLVMIACLSVFAGIILDVVTKGRQELKRLIYLSIARFGEH